MNHPIALESPAAYISRLTSDNKIIMFTHAKIRFKNDQIEHYLNARMFKFAVLYLDRIGDEGRVLEAELERKTKESTPPWIFVHGVYRPMNSFIASFHDGMINDLLSNSQISYSYDLIILGNGTGAITAAVTAAAYKKNLLLCEIERWKTMPIPDACLAQLPAQVELDEDPVNSWRSAVRAVDQYCTQTMKEFKQKLKLAGVRSAMGNTHLLNEHTIFQSKAKKTALNILIATESKCQHVKSEFVVVDKLFRNKTWPGITGVLGNSMLAIQVVSLLNYLRVPVTLLRTGTILEEFDQDVVKILVMYLTKTGISIEPYNHEISNLNFKTIVMADKRVFDYRAINAHNIGLEIDHSSLITNKQDRTNVNNIYAIGDIVLGKSRNEKMCADAASLLMKRLYGMQHELMDYTYLPVVIRGTLEYGSVGLSEEKARKKHGFAMITVFQSFFKTFDHFLNSNLDDYFVKVVCYGPAKQVIGLHIIGQNVSAMLPVYALNMKKVLLKSELDITMSLNMSGIHTVTNMYIKPESIQ